MALVALLVAVTCGRAVGAPGPEALAERPFWVGGTIEGRARKQDFQMHVWGAKWQLTLGVVGDDRVTRRVVGSDDTGTLGQLSVQPGAAEAFGAASLVPGRIPFGHTEVPVLWLAFAGSAWLRSQATNAIRPMWNGRAQEDEGLRVIGRLEFAPDAPHLPRRLAFFNDGTERRWMPAEQQVKVWTNGWQFKHGYTNALLVTEGWTSVAGLEFPGEVKFWEFRPKSGRTSNDLEVTSFLRLTVTNARVGGALDSYLPGLPAVARVKDFRLPAAAAKGTNAAQAAKFPKHPEYTVADRKWPGEQEAQWRYVRGPWLRRVAWWAGWAVAAGVAGWGLWRAVRGVRARRAAEAKAAVEGGE